LFSSTAALTFYPPGALLVGTATLKKEKDYREEQIPLARFRLFGPKDVRQCSPMSSFFSENADYVPFAGSVFWRYHVFRQ